MLEINATASAPVAVAEGPAPSGAAPASALSKGRTRRGVASRASGPGSVAPDQGVAHRPASSLGLRASVVTPAAAPAPVLSQPEPAVAILGSGIFVGGNEPLQIGSRYFLARVGPELQALGPIHISPSIVAARVKMADTQATVIADRLLITGRDGERGPTLAFSAVSAEYGVDLEASLNARPDSSAVAT